MEKQALEKEVACKIVSVVCDELPNEFDYLSHQFKEGLILGAYILNASQSPKGFRQFVQDRKVLNKYENKKGKEFIIDNIYISDLEGKNHKVSITVAYGIFIGYTLDKIEDLDITTVNAKDFKIKYRGNVLDKLFSDEELKYLNSNDVYEVELDGKIYYHLFDIEDGDFIGMDTAKKVYKITHDPYEITLVGEDLMKFLKSRFVE